MTSNITRTKHHYEITYKSARTDALKTVRAVRLDIASTPWASKSFEEDKTARTLFITDAETHRRYDELFSDCVTRDSVYGDKRRVSRLGRIVSIVDLDTNEPLHFNKQVITERKELNVDAITAFAADLNRVYDK